MEAPELLLLTPKQLANKRVCSAHFQVTDFINSDFTSRKRRLKRNAVPARLGSSSLDSVCDTDVPLSDQNSPTVLVEKVTPELTNQSSPVACTEEKRGSISRVKRRPQLSVREQRNRAQKKIDSLTAKLKKARQAVRNVSRKNLTHLSIPEVIEGAAHYLDADRLLLLKLQLNHMKSSPFQEDEKQFDLGLFYKSPKAYVFLRDKKKIPLPCVTLIRQWINDLNLTTGISPEFFETLKTKAGTMSKRERQCVLMWDEMSIKRLLEYNRKDDFVEGFQDLGHLGRSDQVANYALVFMLRGLTSTWKQPIAFYVSRGNVDGNDLTALIKQVVNAVFDAGLIVRSMVCDQGSPNRKAIAVLGITEEKPFTDISGHKIFFNFDVPHLVKSIRNNLLGKDFMIDGSTISWNSIRELRNAERDKPCRAAPKLSDRHIDPTNFQRMNVKLATQIFSASVSAAMTAGQMTGDLKDVTNSATANFVKRINDIFDCLNSRNANDANPLKRALSEKSPQVQKYLEDSLQWLSKWTIPGSPNPPCFSGLRLSIQSILMLWSDLRNEDTLFLLTTRLNQDPLENLFSILRSRCGHNDNPSVMQFRRNLQYAMTINLMKPPAGTNCEEDNATVLMAFNDRESMNHATREMGLSAETEENLEIQENRDENDDTDDRVEASCDMQQPSCEVTLEVCAIKYVAGYLLHKCINKFNCLKCQSNFIKDNQDFESNDELLIFFKSYKTADGQQLGHLKAPVDKFHTLIVSAYRRFEKEFRSHVHEKHLGKYLGRCIHETLATTNSDVWTVTNDDCQEHRDYIVDLFVRTHVFNHLKWISRDIRDQSSRKRNNSTFPEKPNRKILKVTHC